ncbi:MAG: DEAD/DEAH box helicase, partial [Phycisphaerae bacterium]
MESEFSSYAENSASNLKFCSHEIPRRTFGFDELKRRGPFDLLVIDEASQVSLAHAIMLATLAECTIFAGDPRQLAPIVQSANDLTGIWLGTSIFDQVSTRSPGMCMLTEQSRMAPAICHLVSTCFYDSKLVVASREAADPAWHAQRKLAVLPQIPATSVMIQHIPNESKYSQKYGGHIRYESAELICRLVHALLHAEPHNEILVLTPFRSQRVLLRQGMQRIGNPRVAVRTVH